MTNKIVYKENSGIVVVSPAPGVDAADIIDSVVPSGITGYIVDASALPSGPVSLWTLDDKGILGLAPYVASDTDVDRERDRRMYGGFVFNGVVYQTDSGSISNILGAAQLAFMSIVGGAKQGDLTWAGATPFAWIAADNQYHTMDAYTVVNFAKAAAAYRSGIIYAARAAKDALAAGQTIDVTADATWGADASSPTSTAKVG